MAILIFQVKKKERKKLNICLPFLYHSRKCWVNFARFGDVEGVPQLLFFAYELHQNYFSNGFNSNKSPNSFQCNLLVITTSPRSEECKDAFEENPLLYQQHFIY